MEEVEEGIEGNVMNEKYVPNIDILKNGLGYSTMDYERINKLMQENMQTFDGEPIIPDDHFEKEQDYWRQSLAMLQSINQNTANLYTLVDLINRNNENQEELLDICNSIFDIATAKSKEEAKYKFMKVMSKINDLVKDADSMIKIINWTNAVYIVVSQIL